MVLSIEPRSHQIVDEALKSPTRLQEEHRALPRAIQCFFRVLTLWLFGSRDPKTYAKDIVVKIPHDLDAQDLTWFSIETIRNISRLPHKNITKDRVFAAIRSTNDRALQLALASLDDSARLLSRRSNES